MATQIAQIVPPPTGKKKLARPATPENSQRVRHTVQLAFVALNAWLGIQFYLWARFFERGGVGLRVPRPAGAEGWLPIAGLMNFKAFVTTGRFPVIHPAAMFLFMAFVGMSLVAKKSFCSWLCPGGNLLREFLAGLGKSSFCRNLQLPRWLGYSAALPQISAARFLRFYYRVDVGRGHRGNLWPHPTASSPTSRCSTFFAT